MARKNPALTVVPPAPDRPATPPELGEHGGRLWASVTGQYDVSDAGGRETLWQACMAADRAEACRKLIDEQGKMIVSRGQMRSHPLLRDELANRAFVTRSIARLGLDLEPIRSGPGRPPGGVGWTGA